MIYMSPTIQHNDIDVMRKEERAMALHFLSENVETHAEAVKNITSYYDTIGQTLFHNIINHIQKKRLKPSPTISSVLASVDGGQYGTWMAIDNDIDDEDNDDFETAIHHYIDDLEVNKDYILMTLDNSLRKRSEEIYWRDGLINGLRNVAKEIRRLNTSADPFWTLINIICTDAIAILHTNDVLDTVLLCQKIADVLSQRQNVPFEYQGIYPLLMEHVLVHRGSLLDMISNSSSPEEISLHV